MQLENPYTVDQTQKEKELYEALKHLTAHHAKACPEYSKILKMMYPNAHEIPYLPVSLFKHQNLKSIPDEKVFKTLLSSGTTTSIPSKIFLDGETAALQTKALASIMTSWIGKKRLPMLIVDTPGVIKNRASFSARGAGILGMMNFGRDHLYALTEDFKLDRVAIEQWAEKHQEGPILVFGFTFMVWKYLLGSNPLSLPPGTLIHSGGWKKLQDEAVSNALFKQILQEKTGIAKCHNFYGMVEQVGSVFVECEKGYLHPPRFADVIIRHPKTWAPLGIDEEGAIQVLSALPKSYPGHSLLTEDLGRIVSIDSCPCGRKGKAFEVLGRVPKTEIRGCSDTQGE